MPPKEDKKDLSYSESIKEIKKLSSSLQKMMNTTLKKLEDTPEQIKKQLREERIKAFYEKNKEKYKFTESEKADLLDRFIMIDFLPEAPDREKPCWSDEYDVDDFIQDTSPDLFQKARNILLKARDVIEDLLPATVASTSLHKYPHQELRLHGRRKERAACKEATADEEDCGTSE